MPENAKLPQRRSVRLSEYDYAGAGAYFLTVVTDSRALLFGAVVDDEMRLNDLGRIVEDEWLRTAEVRQNVLLDSHVVMPNHFHGILILQDSGRDTVGATRRVARAPVSSGPQPGSIGAIMAQFKSLVAKRINAHRGSPGAVVWQRSFYEHIIRNETDLDETRRYIAENPLKWALDAENPGARVQVH